MINTLEKLLHLYNSKDVNFKTMVILAIRCISARSISFVPTAYTYQLSQILYLCLALMVGKELR